MTAETTWRDEFDVVLKTIVLPGEFDILDATDRSRWLGALQQSYDAGRNKAEEYKENAERYLWMKANVKRIPLAWGQFGWDVCIDKARKA